MRLVKYWLDASVLFLLGCLISLSVQAAPPTFSLAISPATIAPGQIATFTYTIDNTLSGNGTASALTFSNTLPANVVFANPSNASTTCIGGSLSATAGGSTLTFTDYRLGSGQSCTVSATVTSSTAGTHVNTTGVLSSSVGSSGTATANLTVNASLPSLTIAFSPATISPGNISTLIYTIDNTNTGANASLLTLADTLPTGVTLAFIPNPQTTCASGNFVAASNSTTFSFSSASVVNGASCQISVDVTASSLGTYHHTTGIMSSNGSNPSGSAQAILTVENVFLSAAFPNFAAPGTSVTLTYTMINRDRGNNATSISFSNDLNATLSGLTATALPASGFCGAGSTISGTSTITISGANLVAEASCTFSLTVLIPTNAAAGSYTNNTSIVTLNLGGSATTKPAASNSLIIKKAPILTMAFIDDPVVAGQDVTARFTVTNTDSANAISAINYSWVINDVITGITTKTLPSANSCGTGSTFTTTNINGVISFTMANGALAAGANCTFDVVFTISASQPPGSYLVTTSAPTSVNSGVTLTSLAASDTLVVIAAPTLSLAIVESSIEPNGSVTAQFTLNYNANASSDVTGVGFTVDLGSALTGLTSTTATQNNVCGTGSSFSGTSTLTLAGGSLVAGGSCTFSVNLKVPNNATPATITVASSTISGTTSGQSVSAAAASDTLIISGLTLTKQFVSSPYLPGQNAILRYTITNHANALAATAIAFTDNLSQALSTTQAVSLPTTPCGGSSTITGTNILNFAAGELTPGTSCTFDVTILIPAGAAAGSYASTTSAMTATVNGGNTIISAASAVINVEILTVNLSTTVGTSTETSPIPVVIDFSRAVTNFISTDLVIGNGSVTSLTGSGSSYSATITPAAAGAVTVDLPANAVDDAVDNNHKNPAANQLSITYVSTPVTPTPTISISAASVTQATSGPVSYTVTYTNAAEINLTANLVTVNKTGTVGNPTINVTNGNTATATVTLTNITGDGTVGISLAANTARNGIKSAAAAGPSGTALIDNTKPTVTITDTVAAVINSSPFTATFTFDEAVTGFAQGDISATNATLSNFTAVSSTVYTVAVTPTAQGTVTLNVAANVAFDGLSNGNNAATQHSVSYDTVSPTIAISGPSSAQNGAFTATFTFNEDVSGFIKDDIVAGNAIVSAFASVSATTYTATVTPGTDGPVTLDVAANTAIDTATNGNTAASQYSVTYDMTKPTVAVTANNNPFNGAITATFTFSEDISGFTLGDIIVANGVASNLTTVTANRVFTATITPTAQGTYTIDVPAAAVSDGAGNTSNAASQLSLTFDNTRPTVTTAIASGPVNTAFTATFTFSEAVTGFSAADISVTNGTAGTVNATSITVYTATITPTADGLVTVNVPAGGASDSATNTNTAATAVSLTYDITLPTVQVSTVSSAVNSAFTATITFSEAVTGVVQGDITATNATLSGFAATNSQVYTVTVTPQAEGTVTLNVAAAVANDGAGNSNSQASPLSINYDLTKPTAVISGPAGPISSGFSATATFSEAVTGFAQSDITVSNGTLSNFVAVSSTVYTVTVTPAADGPITLNIAQNVAQDSASNGNSAASQFSVTSDLTPPTLVISGPTGVLNAAFTATFTFSEGVSGFSQGDVSVTNGSIGTVTAVSSSVYTATVTPTAEGLVNVNVAANGATDSAGNGNTVAGQYQVSFDNSIPSVVISGPVIANSAFTATITFSEDVTGFTIADISATNGTLASFTATSAKVYTVAVTPIADGTVSLNIAANGATDSATNGNSAATPYSVNYDATAPTLVISGPTGSINVGFTANFTFSENVTGFTVADILATNGVISNFSAIDGKQYSATVTPATDGLVTLSVAANSAVDIANNPNLAASQYSLSYDVTKPTLVVSGPTGPVNGAISLTFTFSEAVVNFSLADITVVNGAMSQLVANTSGSVYTATLTPTTDGTTTVNVSAGVATDLASNTNLGAVQYSVLYDSTKSGVVISGPVGPVNSPFTATFTFSEAMTGFTSGDINATNATVSNFVATSSVLYTATITPTTDGTVIINVAADVAFDSANNGNAQASPYRLEYDITRPTVVIAAPAGPVNAAFTATFTFSETVSGFSQSDLQVSNASVSQFVAVSGLVYTATITPTSDGQVTINLPANSAIDTAGNNNVAASQYQLLYEITRPSVAISAVGGPVNVSFVATVTFSESVSQFTQGDITVSNASLSDFKTLSASLYSVVVTPIVDGQVTVNIAANVAMDAATNGNTAASQLALIYDITKPTLVISGPTATVNTPFTATFTFSEAVSGFTIDDIQVNFSSLSNFTQLSASVFTVLVSPSVFGAVVVDVAANAAIDAATNGNAKGSALTVNFDSTPPVLTFDGPAGPVNSSIKLAIKASEAVTDFTIDDITTENATLTGFSQIDPLAFEVTVNPIADGTVKVNIAGQAVKDLAGNFNDITAEYTVLFDGTAPGVVISGGSAVINQPFVATFTFNANVSGFTVDDIVVGNGSLSEFTTVSSAVYQVKVTPISDGEVILDVGADSASDTAGNGNVPALRYRVIYDKTPPTFTIDGPTGSVNAAFTATLNFNEVVSGVDVSDVKVTNATLSSFATTDNQRYTMIVTPLVNGIVSLDVAAGVAQDTAGNNNSAAVTYSVTYDVVLSSLTISGPDGTVNGPFTVNFDFSKEVSGFSQTDITVINGLLSGFNQITGARYSVLVTPQNAGNVSINVAANVAQDSAGNGNSAATGFAVNYDNGAPTVTLSAPTIVNDRFAVNIRFSEPVSGFEATDVNVSNANLLSFQALSTSEYRIDLEPLNSGLVIVAIAANVAQNTQGNGNEAATDLQVEFDDIPPTVTATDPVDDALDASGTTHLLITFDEIINAAPGNDKLIELFEVGNEVAIASFVASSDKVKIDIHQVSLVDPLQLKANQQYYLHITSGAFVDVVGNPYAGINDETSWNFTVDNIAPVAVADSVEVDEDTPVVIDVLANDFDNDGSVDKTTVTLVQTSDVAILTVDPQTGAISYTPSSNFNGQDSFSYTVNDDLGKTSNTATVTVTVVPINDAPTAENDSVTTIGDLSVAIDILANDSDIDGTDTLSIDSVVIVTAPSNGSVTINAGSLRYDPVDNYAGIDSFSYTVADPQGAVSNVATVTINVISINGAPVAVNDNSQTNEDTAVLIDVLSNDQDPENNLDVNSIVIVTQPANGIATVVNGQINYLPTSNYFGQDSFTYQVSDGDGQASNSATVSITIIAQTDAPIAANDSAVTDEDVAIVVDVTANDSSVDTTINVNSVVIVNQPSNGSVTVGQAGSLNYRPSQDFFGQDSFSYTVRDSNGVISAPATVSIVVNSINDAPVITSQAPTQANPASEYRYQLVASDVDGDNLTITTTGPSWLVFDGVDTLSGIPPIADIGQVVSVKFLVTDNVIVTPISQRFDITVNEPTATTLALTSVASENPTKVANNIDIRYTITNNGQVSGLLDTLTIELTGTSGLNSVPTNCLVSVNANNRDVVSCTLASSLAPGASEILTINLPVVVNGDGEIVSRAQLSQQRVSTFVSKTLVVLVTEEIVDQPGQVLPPSSTADSAFGDVNNDGLADLVIVNTNGQANQIHHNIGAGQFEPQQTFDEGSDSRGVALADLDNDGFLDIVVANHGTSPSGFYLNDGAGNFSTITSFGQLLATGVSVADFNGDGLLDIVFGTDQQVGNRIFIQPFDFGVPRNALDDKVNMTSDRNLSNSEVSSNSNAGIQARVAANAIAVATGDLNGDQHIDIVIGYENSGLEILYNAGDGSFTSVIVQSLIDAAVVVVADINNDGMSELFVSHRDGNTMILGATSPDNLVQINTTSAQDIAITDVNNDGQLDVMLINDPGGIRVFNYHADNTFTRSQTVIAVTGDGIAVADLDGDGDVDIIVTSRDENLGDEILFNEGAGNFGSQTVDLGVTLTTVSEVTEETSYDVELAYSNSGLGAGVAVQLHYVIDNGLLQGVVAADPSQVSCEIISTVELTCNQASMATASSQGVVVTVVAGSAGTASHTVSISNASTDEDLTNNQLTDTVIVNAKPVPPEPPTPEPPTPEPPTPEPPTPEPPKRRSGGSLSWLLLLCGLVTIRRLTIRQRF